MVELVGAAGGGAVEGYPREQPQKKLSASFLATGTRPVFESAGFEFVCSLEAMWSVMRRTVPAS